MPYTVTKTYGHELGLSAVFRQYKAHSHCAFLHGYALSFSVTFGCEALDESNWVFDFGALKPLKDFLAQTFDHKLVVAEDDPELFHLEQLELKGLVDITYVKATGCESFAKMVYDWTTEWLQRADHHGVWVELVRVSEHGGNSAAYHRED